MSDSKYTPGTYVKGDKRRIARSASAAVALEFEGYVRQGDLPAEVTETEASPAAQPVASTPGTPAPRGPVPTPPKTTPEV